MTQATAAAAGVHGWGVAFLWAAGFFSAAFVASLFLIRTGKIEGTVSEDAVPVHVG